MTSVDLYHLGDQCAPGIIIDDILHQKKKTLFMLAIYEFNDILHYLLDNQYEKIYSKPHLKLLPNNTIQHTLYKFIFKHDYVVKNSKVVNYDMVKSRFDTKIKNFREMLASDTFSVFITFTQNVDNLKIHEMLSWLRTNKPKFHLMIFTNTVHAIVDPIENLSIVVLDNVYDGWWLMEKTIKCSLYKEIYEKFIACLQDNGIAHSFPKTFEETNYSA
jgi:hypothetical protein